MFAEQKRSGCEREVIQNILIRILANFSLKLFHRDIISKLSDNTEQWVSDRLMSVLLRSMGVKEELKNHSSTKFDGRVGGVNTNYRFFLTDD